MRSLIEPELLVRAIVALVHVDIILVVIVIHAFLIKSISFRSKATLISEKPFPWHDWRRAIGIQQIATKVGLPKHPPKEPKH